MKKRVILSLMLVGLVTTVSAQQEPDFVGSAIVQVNDTTFLPLEKQVCQGVANSNAASYLPIAGAFAGKTKLISRVDGASSPVKVSPVGGKISIIIRVKDNSVDPMGVISLFKLQYNVRKNYRYVETASVGALHSGETPIHFLPFQAEKYGSNSYLLKIYDLQPGEYALTLAENKEVFNLFCVQ